MDKKYVMLAVFLFWSCLGGYAQDNIGRLYDEFAHVGQAGRIHIDLPALKMLGFSIETADIETIDIFDFDPCAPPIKERFAAAAVKVNDTAYETLFTAKQSHTVTRVMIRIKEEVVREVVIFRTGQKNGMIRIRGAIRKSKIEEVIKSYGDGC